MHVVVDKIYVGDDDPSRDNAMTSNASGSVRCEKGTGSISRKDLEAGMPPEEGKPASHGIRSVIYQKRGIRYSMADPSFCVSGDLRFCYLKLSPTCIFLMSIL